MNLKRVRNMAEYWLVWSKFEDNSSRIGLPGGFKTLKKARECAYENVVTNHPIEIDGSASGEVIKKVKGIVYSEKTTRSGTTRQRVLQDGSVSKTKIFVKTPLKTAAKLKAEASSKTKTPVKTAPKKKRKYGELLGDAAVHFGSELFSHL